MTNDPVEEYLGTLDRSTLTPLVQRALGSDTVEVTDWKHSDVHGGFGGLGSIHRFHGSGLDAGESVSWSLILKAIRSHPRAVDPSSARYWRREVEAYKSGALDQLPAGLTAVRCYGIVELSHASLLWLEEIPQEKGAEWSRGQYVRVARHLGRLNGAYLAGEPPPTGPWVTRRWLREYLNDGAQAVTTVLGALDHPLVRLALPPDCATRFQSLCEHQSRLLDAIESLPSTFCHLDAHRRNLFATASDEERTVAIDWAFTGMGAVGEELACLGIFAPKLAVEPDFSQAIFQAYLEGLGDTGWVGDPTHVRFAYAAAAALRHGICNTALVLAAALDPDGLVWLEKAFGCTAEQLFASWSPRKRLFLGLGEEACQLLDSIHLPEREERSS